jgi:hypothetical protein
MSESRLPKARVWQPVPEVPGITYVEAGIEYRDGAHITVEWSDEDETWYARCQDAHGGTLADGSSRELALLSLCCALSATIAVYAENERLPRNGGDGNV